MDKSKFMSLRKQGYGIKIVSYGEDVKAKVVPSYIGLLTLRHHVEAAAVVRGRSSNGYDEWKMPDGTMTFGDYLRSKEVVDGKLQGDD